MKDGTEALMKFKLLQRDLRLPLWQARGLLDTLWAFVKKNCPRGDLGRFTNEEIAVGIEWEGDAELLVHALVGRKWLDTHQEHRLIVHDWPDHAEDTVHKQLARKKQFFADGTPPKTTRLEKSERDEAEKYYSYNTCAPSVPRTHGERTANAPAEPSQSRAKPSLSKPEAVNARHSRSGSLKQDRTNLDRDALSDLALLATWFKQEAARRDAWLDGTDFEWEQVQAVAAKVLNTDGIRDPVAVAKWLIRGRHWDYLSATHEELARLARRDMAASPSDPIVAGLANAFKVAA